EVPVDVDRPDLRTRCPVGDGAIGPGRSGRVVRNGVVDPAAAGHGRAGLHRRPGAAGNPTPPAVPESGYRALRVRALRVRALRVLSPVSAPVRTCSGVLGDG